MTQPLQVALLCYLALARPRGLHSRDTLIALLWPDHDDSRGRHALRNALHGLRNRLGAGVIVSTGANLVGLDTLRVYCDAFDLEHGRIDAEHLSGGDSVEPLQGLHVQGAGDFDQWMTMERARLSALLDRRRSAHPPELPGQTSPRPRHVGSSDAWIMHARGHYLFLRTAHGGSAADLLRSRDYFERARSLDPEFAPAVAGLANFYAVASRRGILAPFDETFDKAIELSKQAAALDATLAVPHVHFGVKALYLDDDWERAGAEFSTAVAKDPSYAEGHRFYGVWLGLAGRHDEALGHMEQAAALEPDIPQMVSSLAAARLAVGDRTGAEASLRLTLTLEPRHGPARERLVRLLEDGGRFEEAVNERSRPPAMRGADVFRSAFIADGIAGYRTALRDTLIAEIEAIEVRLLERQPATVNDIFSPPVVQLVALSARVGDRRRVKTWQLDGVAARPMLARWFGTIPELQRTL